MQLYCLPPVMSTKKHVLFPLFPLPRRSPAFPFLLAKHRFAVILHYMDNEGKNRDGGPGLRLIEGGLPDKEKAEKIFRAAFVTNTRLMGEIALGIHWRIKDHPEAEDLYQFFSFDVQECGLDNYMSVWDGDAEDISLIRQTLVGPLGGEDVIITEKEARYLFCRYYHKCVDAGMPLPPGKREYAFLLEDEPGLDGAEYDALFKKMCADITCDNELINYFLMRVFSKDHEGAAYLAVPGMDVDLYPDLGYSLFCRNVILRDGDLFVCRSLIEHNDSHRLIVSELTVEDGRIASHRHVSDMYISPEEASMMLTRPEFVTVFRIVADPDIFTRQRFELKHNMMITDHSNGRLFMAFRENNDHVRKSTYRLNDDVLGLYFVSAGGEFIVAAYDEPTITRLEREVLSGTLGLFLLSVAKFEFKDPILYEFIDGEFDEFMEFVSMFTDE